MKVTHRFMLRAGLVLCAAGALGAFGACKSSTSPVTPPPPPPPPPPSSIPAPTGVTATPVSGSKINVAWTDTTAAVTRFQVGRCSGAACTNFVTVKDSIAAATKTFGDSGLTANTSYSYRVRAFSAKDSSAWSTTVSATTLATSGSPAFTMIGAGEVTTCLSSNAPMGTAKIVDSLLKADTGAIAFVAGDALADTTAGSTYANCYDPKWGSFKDRTYFAIGNGDYAGGRGSAGVYGYMGNRTGPAGEGYFSFDKGNWHIVVLNSADWEGGIHDKTNLQDPSSQINMWLANDLAAVPPTKCIMAISWDRRIYTTGTGTLGLQFNMKQAANLLYAAGADLLVSSKDKIYAQFPQTNADGVADAKGFRQFIVGTGGRSLDQIVTPAGSPPSPVVKQQGGASGNWGVLKLTLNDNSYSWDFIPTVAGGFTDSGTTPCHN